MIPLTFDLIKISKLGILKRISTLEYLQKLHSRYPTPQCTQLLRQLKATGA